MNLYQEILIRVLQQEEIHVSFPNLSISSSEIIQLKCYEALLKIKTIIEDDSLSDFECVEEIVHVLECIGSDGGNRHDF